jgi:predicted  nucleic acid-binding Zn-ribbon protein
MSENCSNCVQAKMLEKVDERVTKLEEKCQVMQEELSEMKTSSAVNEDRTKSLFKMLNEIKDSIKIIANKIDSLENKPGQNWNELIKTIIVVATTAAVTYLINK